jgi:DNA-binding IclR family transcriptional regulator
VNEDKRSAVKSADRVLDLFELLGEWGPDLSHSELANRLEIPKSSLTQLLRNLIARGYVRHVPETRTYRLGASLETLVRRKAQLEDLPALAQPFLERITEATQESSFLNLLNGDTAQLAGRVIGPQTLVTVFDIGKLVPLYSTAGSRAILAFLPDNMREDYLSRVTVSPVTSELASAEVLRQRVEQIRRERLSVSHDELVLGIVGIAAPVLSSTGYALGSIAVSLPTVRHDEAKEAQVARALHANIALLQRQLASADRA